jgi:LPXTG-motif cell wall-anchored protein
MGRRTFVAATVLIALFVFGFGSTAGAANYPPQAKTDATVSAASASAPANASTSAAGGAPLPFTGSNSAQLVWAGGALLVAGAALAGRGRRRAVRR